jgi:uncharacterized Fe-S cluster-containing radical SAM superfamily enzyme
MTASEVSEYVDFDEGRFNIACRIVDQMKDGLLTAMLTGQGEPLLFPKQITRYMDLMNLRFPHIELQTNGVLVEQNLDNLKKWRNAGLTLVCLSVASSNSTTSNRIMGIKSVYNYWHTAKVLMDIGLNVRLNCTMTCVGLHTSNEAETMIAHANNIGILQTTFREVEMPTPCKNHEVGQWVEENKPFKAARNLYHYLALNGAVELLRLPHGGVVYDYKDQNVAIGNCLTGTTDPDDIRQIIFFPDGRVAYDWRYKGARLL